MSEAYYQLAAPPFQLTPDSRFYFASAGHARAIAHLTFGLAQNEGFVVVTGEVGAGKTTLIEHLVGRLDPRVYAVSRIATTRVSGEDLVRLALAGFGLEDPDSGKAALLRRFETVLRDHRQAGRRCLLIVDEAQTLTPAALEELRMLSNLTDGGRASLQTILLGQPQFRDTLRLPELDQLRQRVLAAHHLGALSAAETQDYILHRLTAAGWQGYPDWDDAAFAAVFARTGGVPRRINRLCGRVLLAGALEQTGHIAAVLVEDTADELADDLDDAPSAARADAGELAGLMLRVQAVEQQVAAQDRLLRRLLAAREGE